jgi:hypothetical protein
MAHKKTVTTASGITVEDAYVRVEALQLSGKTTIEFDAVSYVSDQHTVPFAKTRHTGPYDMNGGNPFEQAYTHLKSMPQFADAIDC